jgi:hypothetical protein
MEWKIGAWRKARHKTEITAKGDGVAVVDEKERETEREIERRSSSITFYGSLCFYVHCLVVFTSV